DPDIAGTQRTAEIPQRAQLIIPAADGPVLLPDVGPPRVSNQAHGRLAGDRPARRSPIQRADHLHGPKHRVIRPVGMEGEGLQKGRCKLADCAVPGAKKVDGLVLTWPNQPGCFVDGSPQRGFWDVGKTDGPYGRIVN